MKKIITAINNPKINNELKKEKNFEIIGKDIQYREAILDILNIRKDIDTIIICEKILGKIDIENLIKEIRKIKSNINIIFFLERKNKEKIKSLNENNIINVYTKKDFNIKNIIRIINKKEIDSRRKNKFSILNIISKYEKNIKSKKSKVITIIGNSNLKKIDKYIEFLRKINKKVIIINFQNYKNIEKRIQKLAKKYNYIFIKEYYIKNKKITSRLIRKSDKIIFYIEYSYIGINEIKIIKEYYYKYIKITNKKYNLIIKYEKINSVSFLIIKNLLKKF